MRDRDAEQVLPYDANDSPFPEVRAVVQPTNDLSLPVNTVRMWTIGLLFTIVCWNRIVHLAGLPYPRIDMYGITNSSSFPLGRLAAD